jgi:hypothetical protein
VQKFKKIIEQINIQITKEVIMGVIIELPIVVIGGQAFEAIEFLGPDKPFLPGTTMWERIKNISNLADRSDANLFLLRQTLISDAWRQIVPVFAKTPKCGRFGYQGFYHLGWCEHLQRWYLDSRWLGWGFGKDCRLIRHISALTFEAERLVLPSL